MNEIWTWCTQNVSEPRLLFWVVGSVVAYAIGANALWLARRTSLWRQPYFGWLAQLARFLFYFGVPYLALGGWPRQPLQGLLSLDDVGLVGITPLWPATRWLQAFGTGLGLGLIAYVVLLLAWAQANSGAGRDTSRPSLGFPHRGWWALLVDVLYLEVHWAFYRGALAVALDDLYTGVFVGLGLVYVEWGLSTFWRQGWGREQQATVRWLRAAMALVSTIIFLLMRSLWVCLLVHALIELTFWQLGRARSSLPRGDNLKDAGGV